MPLRPQFQPISELPPRSYALLGGPAFPDALPDDTAPAVRAYDTLHYIESNLDQWDQQEWTSCFAGLTARRAGYHVQADDGRGYSAGALAVRDDVGWADLFDVSAWLLGLRSTNAMTLFGPHTLTESTIRWYIPRMFGLEPAAPLITAAASGVVREPAAAAA